MRDFNVSRRKVHICPTLAATQFPHCHVEYYSPRGQAISTSHLLDCWAICVSKRDLPILASIRASRRDVSMNFRHFRLQRPWSKTLVGFKLFAQPMDQAEVLHSPSYSIELSWKNTPEQNELVDSCEKSFFHTKKYI